MKYGKKTFGSSVVPYYNRVIASIYYTLDDDPDKYEYHLISKDFGSFFRKSPNENDYINAKIWAKEQLELTIYANNEKHEVYTANTVDAFVQKFGELFNNKTFVENLTINQLQKINELSHAQIKQIYNTYKKCNQ